MKGRRFSSPHPRPQALRQNAEVQSKERSQPALHDSGKSEYRDLYGGRQTYGRRRRTCFAQGHRKRHKLPREIAGGGGEEGEAAVLFPSERTGALSYAWPQCTTREAAQQADAPKIRPSPPFFRVERRLHEEILHSSFSFRLLPASDSIAASASPTRHMH